MVKTPEIKGTKKKKLGWCGGKTRGGEDQSKKREQRIGNFGRDRVPGGKGGKNFKTAVLGTIPKPGCGTTWKHKNLTWKKSFRPKGGGHQEGRTRGGRHRKVEEKR